jgi:hypothetical protein
MPYGTIGDETRAYVEMRAAQSNVSDRIDLESDADDAYTLDIIYYGALDESFSIGREYAVNVVDWIGEMLTSQEELGALDTCFWEVSITEQDMCDTVYEVKGFYGEDF